MVNITACMVVKNEDRFVWYAVSSVLPFIDKFIIFDTGSSDKTVEIIKSIKSPKIIFRQKHKTSPKLLTKYRKVQLNMVKNGWIWLVDGDEIYPQNTAEKVMTTVQNQPALIGIIIHRYDLLGDVYHYQDESVGSYNQFGKIGHYVLRLINKNNLPRLQVLGDYPDEYFAVNGKSIKDKGKEYFAFVESKIFHAMYLKRSSRGHNLKRVINRNKFKIETGLELDPKDLPEVFKASRPDLVPDILEKRSLYYELTAKLITPVKKLKRKILE